MSAWVTIRRLECGDYFVKVNEKTNVCKSLVEAATWAEKQMEEPQGPSPAPPDEQ